MTYQLDLDEAVDKYADMVYRIAMTVTKNQTDAQDVFQETFLRLVRYRETIESEEHLKAWLIRVATNCAKSLVTSSWYKNTQGIDQQLTEEAANDTANDNKNQILDYIKELPEKYRIVLYLFYYEEYPVKKISQILAKKETTVKSILSRGRDKLRDKLVKEGYKI